MGLVFLPATFLFLYLSCASDDIPLRRISRRWFEIIVKGQGTCSSAALMAASACEVGFFFTYGTGRTQLRIGYLLRRLCEGFGH